MKPALHLQGAVRRERAPSGNGWERFAYVAFRPSCLRKVATYTFAALNTGLSAGYSAFLDHDPLPNVFPAAFLVTALFASPTGQ